MNVIGVIAAVNLLFCKIFQLGKKFRGFHGNINLVCKYLICKNSKHKPANDA